MWKTILGEVSRAIFTQMAEVIIAMFLLIGLLFAGLVFSYLVKAGVIGALKVLRFEKVFLKVMPARILERTGIKFSATEAIGTIFYWIGLLISLSVILNATGLTMAADLVNKVILYTPNAIAAIFILVFGTLGASFLNNIIRVLAANAGIDKANALGKISEVIAVIFVSVMVLEQLKINVKILETAIGIMLGSAGLAMAVAFGLGCKDIIGKFIAGIVEKTSNPE